MIKTNLISSPLLTHFRITDHCWPLALSQWDFWGLYFHLNWRREDIIIPARKSFGQVSRTVFEFLEKGAQIELLHDWKIFRVRRMSLQRKKSHYQPIQLIIITYETLSHLVSVSQIHYKLFFRHFLPLSSRLLRRRTMQVRVKHNQRERNYVDLCKI